MIKMEIQMNEKKIEQISSYTKEQVYDMIDFVASSKGIAKKDHQGVFIGNNDSQDFANFGKIVLYLKEQEWFLPFVEKWYLYVGDEKDNLAKHYKKKANLI